MVDPVIASRLQFAITAIVHIIFPTMSMGLAPFLICFTWKEIRTEQPLYEQLRRFWTRIFAVSFVVGTVTGLVLESEFGTNFAAFSTTAGELFGGGGIRSSHHAQEAVAEFTDRLRTDEQPALVYYENTNQKQSHRTLFREHLTVRL